MLQVGSARVAASDRWAGSDTHVSSKTVWLRALSHFLDAPELLLPDYVHAVRHVGAVPSPTHVGLGAEAVLLLRHGEISVFWAGGVDLSISYVLHSVKLHTGSCLGPQGCATGAIA